VSHLSSSIIVISSAHVSGNQGLAGSVLANSPVLDYLMPQLSVWQNRELKLHTGLKNIDPYMFYETEQLLQRLGKFCSQLGLSDTSNFEIKLAKPLLSISGQFEEKVQLAELVNKDRRIRAAFDWLHGCYSALAHSQELLSFSYAYERNRQAALAEYRHFEQLNQGMDCYVNCRIEEGKAKLSWIVASPIVIYHLND